MPAVLPDDLVEKAEKELGETESVRTSTLAELRAKVEALPEKDRPHRMDDEYLLAFLRPQKFRADVAFQKVKAYTAFKRDHLEVLKDMKAEGFRELLEAGFMVPLLKKDKEGRLVMCLIPGKIKPMEKPEVMIQWTIFSLEQTGIMFDPYLQVNGVVIVEDLAGFSIFKAMGMMGGKMKKVQDANFKFMSDACPYRLRGMLLINEPVYMDIILAIVRPFMSRKLLDRIQLLGRGPEGLKALHERVGAENLPAQFGGSLEEKPGDWMEYALQLEKEGKMEKVL